MVSADGSAVAFRSLASDLVSNDTNGEVADIFVASIVEGDDRSVSLVSENTSGGAGNGASDDPAISADGKFIAFRSEAWDLTPLPDTNGNFDVFVRDLSGVAPTTALVSVNAAGTAAGNNISQGAPLISADGARVVFNSNASDLVAGDANGSTQDIFERTLIGAPTTTAVTVDAAGITASGSHALWPSPAMAPRSCSLRTLRTSCRCRSGSRRRAPSSMPAAWPTRRPSS